MNTRYSFSASEDPTIDSPGFATTRNFEAVALGDVLKNFTLFLKGAGFVFDGELEIVDHSDAINPFWNFPNITGNVTSIDQIDLSRHNEEIRRRTYDEIIAEFKRQNKGFGGSMVHIDHVLAVLQNLSTQSQKD
jgi:hypothetical protein